MLGRCRSRLADACAFTACAVLYWLRVFPSARTEIRRWRERALSIPDTRLRELAMTTQQGERGNLEGAAAFAVLTPARSRAAVIRAAVAFQTVYDYVDTLAEETAADPRTNALRLHLLLLAALDERRRHPGLEDCHPAASGDDGGYLEEILAACREALRELPSYPDVRGACLRAATRMAVYQSLIHDSEPECAPLRDWAARLTANKDGRCGELSWWETAAGAASSLVIFALFAAAAQPNPGREELAAIEHAYFPAVGALHVLLDSLADRDADIYSGHHSLVSHYRSPAQARASLAALAARARAELAPLAGGRRHQAVLAAMAGFYLSSDTVRMAEGRSLRPLLRAVGPLVRPAIAVLRAHRALSAARAHMSPRPVLARARVGVLESQVVDFPLAPLRAPQR